MPSAAARRGPSAAALWANMAVVYIVWGSTYFGIAVAIETIPGSLMAAIRFLIAGLILIGVDLVRHAEARRFPTRRRVLDSIIVGGLLLGVGNGFVVLAQSRHVPSGIAALLIETMPVWFAVLGWLYFRQRLPRIAIGAIVLGLVGTALLITPTSDGSARLDPLGILLLLIAELGWAHGSIYSQRRSQVAPSALSASGFQLLAGGAVAFVEALLVDDPARFRPETVSTASLVALGYLIFAGSMLAYTSYAWLLRNAPLTLVGTYAYVNPVVAIALGTLFLGEPLTLRTIIASVIILVAVAVIVTSRSRLQTAEASVEPRPTPAIATDGPASTPGREQTA